MHEAFLVTEFKNKIMLKTIKEFIKWANTQSNWITIPPEMADRFVKFKEHTEVVSENDLSHFVSNSAIIHYIENDAEIAIPIDELMHEDGRHLTKKEYGTVLLKYLVKELREHYC